MTSHSLFCLGLALISVALVAGSHEPASARDAMVTFKVHVPDTTPPEASVYMAGNIPSLGPWDPGKVELGKIGDRLYAITLVLPVETEVRFKFTRGTWETVEKGADHEEIADRVLHVVGDETAPFWVENWRDLSPYRESHTVVGDLRRHTGFPATKLGNSRDVLVYLPPGYDAEPDRRYPVLYMHDGQNLFDAATSFIGVEWSVDETVTRMVEAGQIRPLIVVGIENTSDRAYEYTPAPDRARGGGGASLYADFILNDLKPFIDRTYRTLPDRENTGVAGSSLGGIASLYLAWAHPNVFSRVAAMSTSYGWADSHILSFVAERKPPPGVRVWIDMGTAEDRSDRDGDGVPDIIKLHRRMRDILMEEGLPIPGRLKYVEDEGAVHNERAWSARFPRALQFLFPARG
ncbi:MAG: alpha/beta hydrolase-fold protein [Candidatus Eisenbacteria bacterium]